MKYESTILSLSLLATAHANPVQARDNDAGIKWSPCKGMGNTSVPLDCAVISVPLDYTDKKSTETHKLELQRVKAKGKSLGSILVNWGGPGDSGKPQIAGFGDVLQAVTGGKHDIINFAPRGTGPDLGFSCYDDPISQALVDKSLSGDAYDVARGELWAESSLFASSCYAKQAKNGSLIGTAFVARDMMQIVDQLKEDGKLRYWGMSYGTLLGSTAVAMFPDRIDKIILDGVVSPTKYYENKETDMFTMTDKVFEGFCKGCAETPELCPLAKNRTATEIKEYIIENLELIRQNPIALPDMPGLLGGSIIDYSTIKNLMSGNFYNPQTWPGMATLINTYLTGQDSGSSNSSDSTPSSDATADKFPDAIFGIKCSDVRNQTDSLVEMMPVLEARQNASYWAPPSDIYPLRCAQWPIRAKEIYQGDFKVKPANPVLILTNSFDPVTPTVGARVVNENIQGSVLVEQEGYGHCTIAQASLCTAKIIKEYFQSGKLPSPGTKCPVDVPLFTNTDGWDKAVKKLNCANSR